MKESLSLGQFSFIIKSRFSFTIMFVLMCGINKLDKAPRPSISNVIWILSSGTICQLNQIFSNSEAAMLSTTNYLGCKSSQRNILLLIICFLSFCHLFRHCLCFSLFHEMNELTVENWIISRFPLWSTSWHSWCKNTFIEIPELLTLWSFTTK